MLNLDQRYSAIKRCMIHMEVLGVDPKIRQLISMYMEMAYQEGTSDKMKEITNK